LSRTKPAHPAASLPRGRSRERGGEHPPRNPENELGDAAQHEKVIKNRPEGLRKEARIQPGPEGKGGQQVYEGGPNRPAGKGRHRLLGDNPAGRLQRTGNFGQKVGPPNNDPAPGQPDGAGPLPLVKDPAHGVKAGAAQLGQLGPGEGE